MVAITALAAIIIRVLLLIQMSWFVFENLRIYLVSQETTRTGMPNSTRNRSYCCFLY